ncbi:MFS transporter [Corynebacterium tuberculostearicum]|uniref:MFS transporter n=1 Tax=Corynebacterium tuberculostearicum TaxID=38304 RepID=UPI0029343F2C|nr:MFS transporter [Corynebacterium tuberculostearicum]MDV2428275.1 MFS transporter [Corynebacterium tuberculostearicum]
MTRTRRATVAMLLVGLAIFSSLYSTQAILPTLVDNMGLSSTEAAMTVSAATGALALCVVPASILSERFGRGRILLISAVAATGVGLIVPLAQEGWQLIVVRGLQGALLSGAPATAMAWLSEELDDKALPRAMGLYIAGTSVGGLTGRLIPTGLVEISTWRWALFGSALVSLAFAITAWLLLPTQRNFRPKSIHLKTESRALFGHWANRDLALLFLTAFLSMGTFVSMYNFLTFRLIDDFGLAPSLAGLAFLFYLSGTLSSARAGALVARIGHGKTLCGSAALFTVGIALCAGSLPLTLLGMIAFTVGFFAVHSTASGWVGQIATHDRAEASSMYVFSYYFGSSVVGACAGLLFDALSWPLFIAFFTAVALTLTALTWTKIKTD